MADHVYLDLEETIIDNWDSGLLINSSFIRKWLDANHLGDIHIWSFAIYNDQDKNDFVKHLQDRICRVLNRSVLSYPSIAESMAVVFKYDHVQYESRFEFVQLNGKHWSFFKYCMMQHIGEHCILIDDAVPSWTLTDNKTGTTVELINILDIKNLPYEFCPID
jgi:hypothetical protein